LPGASDTEKKVKRTAPELSVSTLTISTFTLRLGDLRMTEKLVNPFQQIFVVTAIVYK
jgi:hypothetical protein